MLDKNNTNPNDKIRLGTEFIFGYVLNIKICSGL